MPKPDREARGLLVRFEVKKVPVPVEDLARHLGIQLSFRPLDGDISGMLFRDGERAVLGVNSAHPHTRQRFTVGHEIGHFLLHNGKPMILDKLIRVNRRDKTSSTATDKEEIEANAFAAELLMPQDVVINEVRKFHHKIATDKDYNIIDELAAIFDVSSSAMEYRLINLGIINA